LDFFEVGIVGKTFVLTKPSVDWMYAMEMLVNTASICESLSVG
jgi:hypothetical protein